MKEEDKGREIEPNLVHNAKMALMGELLAGVAHEIKNPLAFVHANMGNLAKFLKKITSLIDSYEHLDIPEETRNELDKIKADIKYDYIIKRVNEMIEKSKDGVDRTAKIISSINSFSRKNTDKMENADINEAIEMTLNILTHEYKNRIDIIREYGDLPPIKCNIGKLNQVFMNLLVNACQAIKEKGEITIKTSEEGGNLKVRISDTGSGIAGDVLENIFDPFFTTKPDGKGTGIGLAISNDIIKEHNGEISVESSEANGTTFTVKIPVKLS